MPKSQESSTSRVPLTRGYHHGDLRGVLIRTALGMVTEEGAWDFTLREVARQALGLDVPAGAPVLSGGFFSGFLPDGALDAPLDFDGFRRLGTVSYERQRKLTINRNISSTSWGLLSTLAGSAITLYIALEAVGVTMPPWPGDTEAVPVPGKWKAAEST